MSSPRNVTSCCTLFQFAGALVLAGSATGSRIGHPMPRSASSTSSRVKNRCRSSASALTATGGIAGIPSSFARSEAASFSRSACTRARCWLRRVASVSVVSASGSTLSRTLAAPELVPVFKLRLTNAWTALNAAAMTAGSATSTGS